MKSSIHSLASDILITIYVLVSLAYRIKFENELGVSPLQSLVIGACLILIIWSLIKLKILNPNWFGLFDAQKTKL